MSTYEVIETVVGARIKACVKRVPVEDAAREQLENVAGLPFVHSHLAVMPDVHFGRGATVGSVIPTKSAIIPAAVSITSNVLITRHSFCAPLRAPREFIVAQHEQQKNPPAKCAEGSVYIHRGRWSGPIPP